MPSSRLKWLEEKRLLGVRVVLVFLTYSTAQVLFEFFRNEYQTTLELLAYLSLKWLQIVLLRLSFSCYMSYFLLFTWRQVVSVYTFSEWKRKPCSYCGWIAKGTQIPREISGSLSSTCVCAERFNVPIRSDVAFTFQIRKPDLAATMYDVCMVNVPSDKGSTSNQRRFCLQKWVIVWSTWVNTFQRRKKMTNYF